LFCKESNLIGFVAESERASGFYLPLRQVKNILIILHNKWQEQKRCLEKLTSVIATYYNTLNWSTLIANEGLFYLQQLPIFIQRINFYRHIFIIIWCVEDGTM
jgi:hypothetical protein